MHTYTCMNSKANSERTLQSIYNVVFEIIKVLNNHVLIMFCKMRLATGNQRNECSNGSPWLKAKRAAVLNSLQPLTNGHAAVRKQSVAVV